MNKEYPIEEELEEAYKTIAQLYPIEKELEDEIAQLTNNWNELEEYVKNRSMGTLEYNVYDEIRDKMKEIKGGNNE